MGQSDLEAGQRIGSRLGCKGNQIVRRVDGDDPQRAADYVERFAAELAALGYPGDVLRTLLLACPDDIVAIRFTLAAGYSQTPGPQAGAPLGGPA